MYRLKENSLTFAVLWVCTLAKEMTEIEILSSRPTHCTYEHAYDMYGAHCGGLGLTELPTLKSGIEILDFSNNKLRELHSDTLTSITSIKFLYLAENQIYLIDDNAISSLTWLQTLDLSKNVIMTLPNSILQLPSLRKLYLSGNPLIHVNEDIQISRPIRAPLELFDLSDCKIKALPHWGLLPQLVSYNISHNPLVTLPAKHFAVMCSLRKVDISKSIDVLKLCSLKPTIEWLQMKDVYFYIDDYTKLNSKEFQQCGGLNNTEFALNATHHRCKSEYLQMQNVKASRRTWLTISGGLAGFLVGFMLLLYIMHRHNVAQTKNLDKKSAPKDGDKQASEILIKNIT